MVLKCDLEQLTLEPQFLPCKRGDFNGEFLDPSGSADGGLCGIPLWEAVALGDYGCSHLPLSPEPPGSLLLIQLGPHCFPLR